jgi:hypothetical protein
VLRPQGFSPSRRLHSTRHLAALFHAASTLGLLSSFRGFPPLVASLTSRPDLPSLPLSPFAVQRSRAAVLRIDPASRVYASCGSVSPGIGFTRRSADRSSRGVSPPRGSNLLGLGLPSPVFTAVPACAESKASSPGLRHFAGLSPRRDPIVVPALQSFKEPRSWLSLFREHPTSPRSVPSRSNLAPGLRFRSRGAAGS